MSRYGGQLGAMINASSLQTDNPYLAGLLAAQAEQTVNKPGKKRSKDVVLRPSKEDESEGEESDEDSDDESEEGLDFEDEGEGEGQVEGEGDDEGDDDEDEDSDDESDDESEKSDIGDFESDEEEDEPKVTPALQFQPVKTTTSTFSPSFPGLGGAVQSTFSGQFQPQSTFPAQPAQQFPPTQFQSTFPPTQFQPTKAQSPALTTQFPPTQFQPTKAQSPALTTQFQPAPIAQPAKQSPPPQAPVPSKRPPAPTVDDLLQIEESESQEDFAIRKRMAQVVASLQDLQLNAYSACQIAGLLIKKIKLGVVYPDQVEQIINSILPVALPQLG